MNAIYKLDGIDIKEYGVFISASKGLLSRPQTKEPVKVNWNDYHGEVVDLSHKYYSTRVIELSCVIKAENNTQFIQKSNAFLSLLDAAGPRQLSVAVDDSEPLLYEVYSSDNSDIDKVWSESNMAGTFTLKLNEPEPVKRVLKYTRTGDVDKTVSITISSDKLVNVYWGDGTHTYDVNGSYYTVSHTYSDNGTYYIVVTGNIDEISTFTTTATIIWNKL